MTIIKELTPIEVQEMNLNNIIAQRNAIVEDKAIKAPTKAKMMRDLAAENDIDLTNANPRSYIEIDEVIGKFIELKTYFVEFTKGRNERLAVIKAEAAANANNNKAFKNQKAKNEYLAKIGAINTRIVAARKNFEALARTFSETEEYFIISVGDGKSTVPMMSRRSRETLQGHIETAKINRIAIMTRQEKGSHTVHHYAIVLNDSVALNENLENRVREGIYLYDSIGNKVYAEKGIDSAFLLDLSAAANSTDDAREAAAEILEKGLIVGEYKGRLLILEADLSEELDEFDALMARGRNQQKKYRNLNNFNVKNCKYEKFPASLVQNPDGNLKEGFVFVGGKKGFAIFSASAGRKKLPTCYGIRTREDIEEIRDMMRKSTLGASDAAEGRIMTIKDAIDEINREGQHNTNMNKLEDVVKGYVVLLEKNDDIDGSTIFREGAIRTAKRIKDSSGAFVQFRPYSVKAGGIVLDDDAVDYKLSQYTIAHLKPQDFTNPAFKKAWNKTLNKSLRSSIEEVRAMWEKLTGIKGINAIQVGETPDIVGDFNAYKNTFDPTMEDSCLNVLNVNRLDNEMRTRMSSQLMPSILHAMRSMTKEQRAIADKIVKGIINETIKEACEMKNAGKSNDFTGEDYFDISFLGEALMKLNKSKWDCFDNMVRLAVTQVHNRVANIINKGAFKTPGSFVFVTADMAAQLIKGKTYLNCHLDQDYIEIYCTDAQAYFEIKNMLDENGYLKDEKFARAIGIKYPSTGVRELLKIRLVTLQELCNRVETDQTIDDKAKKLIIRAYKKLQRGIAMIPSGKGDLEAIAEIAAGMDLDGDEMDIKFSTPNGLDLPAIVWNSEFKMRAVKIVAPKNNCNDMVEWGVSSYIEGMAKQVSFGNKEVGIVTVAFSNLLPSMYMNWTDEVATYVTEMLKHVFGLGTKGQGKYVRQIAIEGERYITKDTLLKDLPEAIANAAATEENIKAIVDELDVLGRYGQELTIDAQKKFYIVDLGWIDRMSRFNLISRRADFRFELTDYGTRFVDNALVSYGKNGIEFTGDSKLIVIEHPMNPEIKYYNLVDDFAEYKTYAANVAMAEFAKLDEVFTNAIRFRNALVGSMVKAAKEKYLPELQQIFFEQRFSYLYGAVIAANAAYRAKREELSKQYLESDFARSLFKNQRDRIFRDIKAYVNTEYTDLVDYIDNEMRVIINEAMDVSGFTKHQVLTAMMAVLISRNIAMQKFISDNTVDEKRDQQAAIDKAYSMVWSCFGKFLKPEMFQYMANLSETYMFEKKVDDSDSIFWEEGETLILDGIADGGAEVNLLDGTYNVELREDGYYVTRPIEEFVKVPEVRDDIAVFNSYVCNQAKLDLVNTVVAGDIIEVVRANNTSSGAKLRVNGKFLAISKEDGHSDAVKFSEEHWISPEVADMMFDRLVGRKWTVTSVFAEDLAAKRIALKKADANANFIFTLKEVEEA